MINREQVLDGEYEKIWEMLEGSYIFGKPVDTNNIRDLVICAFYAGRSSREEQVDQLFQELEKLSGGKK